MTTLEERVSHIEGRMDSLATKEDVARVEARLEAGLGELRGELRADMMKMALGVASMQLLGIAAIAAVMRLLG